MAVQRENEAYTVKMSNLEWTNARNTMIEQQAKAELQALQLLHPDRFQYLKLELKSFIQLLQSQSEQPFHHQNTVRASKRSPSSLAPDSQESSSCRKRRKKMEEGKEKKVYGNGLQGEVAESETGEKIGRRRNRVDVVLERAAICLRKIRRFKTALFSAAD